MPSCSTGSQVVQHGVGGQHLVDIGASGLALIVAALGVRDRSNSEQQCIRVPASGLQTTGFNERALADAPVWLF